MKTKLPQQGRTHKTSWMLISFLVVAFMFIPIVSAVWWNPFTWFGNDNQINLEKNARWVEVYSDNPDFFVYMNDSLKHNTDIYLCSYSQDKSSLKDLDFATSDKAEQKDLQVKDKLKATNLKQKDSGLDKDYSCYYYKPQSNEKFLKFDKHSTHLVYTNESIVALEDDVEIGSLSLTTPDYYYKDGKPTIDVGIGKDMLTHIFYLENYSSEAITNLKTINMRTGLEIERNANLKYLSYETSEFYTYDCSLAVYTEDNCTINGTKTITTEKWNDISTAINGTNYVVGIFSDTYRGDYIDADFDYYGVSVAASPIDWATWAADLSVGINSYWKLDETSGTTVDDELGNDDLTNTGSATVNNATAIINTAYYFDGTNDYLQKANLGSSFGGTNSFTYCIWAYPAANQGGTSDTGYIMMLGDAVNPSRGINFYETGNLIRYRGADAALTNSPASSWTAGNWYHICARYSGTNMEIFKNGVSLFNASDSTSVAADPDWRVGWSDTNYEFRGNLDEGALWTRQLSNDEIVSLYESNLEGCGYNNDSCFGTAPSVVLTSPADGANFSTSSIDFEAEVTDDQYVENVTLYLDGVANETKTTHVNGTYTFSKVVSEGIHNWSILAYDNQSLFNQSETRTFNYTQPPVFVELLSPANGITSNNITINMSCRGYKDVGVTQLNMTIDGVLNYSVTNSTPSENLTITQLLDFSEGSHNWSCATTDGTASATSSTRTFTIETTPYIAFLTPPTLPNYANVSQEYIPMKVNVSTLYFENITYSLRDVNGTNYTQFYTNETYDINFTNMPDAHYHYDVTICTSTDQCNVTETRHINHDNTPPVIEGNYPLNPTDYLRVGDNITVNFTAEDIHLDTCVVNSNGVNYTLPSCNGSTNNSISVPFEGDSWVLIYVNDTFGGQSVENYSWITKVTELGQTFDSTARSGDVSAYYIYLWVNEDYDIDTATFLFSTESETPSLYSFGENKTLFVPEFVVPGFGVDTNVSFGWNMVLDDSTDIDTINQTQLVTTIYLDNCSNYTYQLFNFSLLDEISQSGIYGDIEIFFQLVNNINYGEINSYHIELTNVTQGLVCSSADLFGQSVLYNTEIRHWADEHSTELYYIQRAEIEENGTDVDLYDLDDNHSTEFKITYQNSYFDFVEDAIIQLQRKYIAENLYKTVEAPKTSDEGTAIVHVDLDSNVYRAVVVKNGEVLNTFDNIVFSCESELTGECTQKLLGKIDPQNEIDYDTQRDFAYAVSSGSSSVIVSFTVPSSAPTTLNMQLKQIDQFGNQTLCNKTLTSSAGSIECDYNSTIGDSYLELKLYKDGEPLETKGYLVPEAGGVDFLQNNYVIVVVLMLCLVGMALTSPEWIILTGIVSVVIAGMLWLVNGLNFAMGLGLLMWLVIAAGIIISKLAKQEDR